MESYQEAKEITDSIVKMYLSLAELEKQNKKDSEEYSNLLSLLTKALELEKRKYQTFTLSEKEKEEIYQIIGQYYKQDERFVPITPEMLSTIRALNLADENSIYALDGNVIKISYEKQMHSYLYEAFLYEMTRYLEKASAEERESIIDYHYALIASLAINDSCCSELPKGNFTYSQKEDYWAERFLMPKAAILTKRLLALTDEDITPETIIYVLYTKACIMLLPSFYAGAAMEEMRNSLPLKQILHTMDGKKADRINAMLTLIYTDEKVEERHP